MSTRLHSWCVSRFILPFLRLLGRELHGDNNLSPFPSPSFKISLIQWVTLSFSVQKNHLLVFFSSKIMFTWHIFYTSNSATLQSSPWSHWKLEDQLRGTTTTNRPTPTVLPWSWSPSPRYYRELCPHYRGVTMVTAGKPWSPSLCSSLLLGHQQAEQVETSHC